MIVDSSAIVAILRNEPERAVLAAALESSDICRISAATLLETCVVVDGQSDGYVSRRLDELINSAAIRIEPFTVEQASIARSAYAEFGKGSGHPAKLNFGDCFSYALAIATGERLLFKGDDFGHTDVRSAI